MMAQKEKILAGHKKVPQLLWSKAEPLCAGSGLAEKFSK